MNNHASCISVLIVNIMAVIAYSNHIAFQVIQEMFKNGEILNDILSINLHIIVLSTCLFLICFKLLSYKITLLKDYFVNFIVLSVSNLIITNATVLGIYYNSSFFTNLSLNDIPVVYSLNVAILIMFAKVFGEAVISMFKAMRSS